MENKIKIQLPDGKIIERIPTVIPFGNFQMLIIRYNNSDYIVGNGDEYLRGMPEIFELGKKLKPIEKSYKDAVTGVTQFKELNNRRR